MTAIESVGTVLVAVGDQDAAIRFWTETMGFSVARDVKFGEDSRWVELSPGGGAHLSLVRPQPNFEPGRSTGILFASTDVRADHATLKAAGVSVEDPVGGDGSVPLMFFFSDPDENRFCIVESARS